MEVGMNHRMRRVLAASTMVVVGLGMQAGVMAARTKDASPEAQQEKMLLEQNRAAVKEAKATVKTDRETLKAARAANQEAIAQARQKLETNRAILKDAQAKAKADRERVKAAKDQRRANQQALRQQTRVTHGMATAQPVQP